jgi:hypothetical protein
VQVFGLDKGNDQRPFLVFSVPVTWWSSPTHLLLYILLGPVSVWFWFFQKPQGTGGFQERTDEELLVPWSVLCFLLLIWKPRLYSRIGSLKFWEPTGKWICTREDHQRVSVPHSNNRPTLL